MYLRLKNTQRQGHAWPIDDKPLHIGRGEGCDIRLHDPYISRRHLRIWREESVARFEDEGSIHGVLLNGRPVHAGVMQEGDTLTVGGVAFSLTQRLNPHEIQCDPPYTGTTTARLSEREGKYFSLPESVKLPSASARTIHDLHDLYLLGREIGAVVTQDELQEALHAFLDVRFQPKERWLCYVPPEGDDLLHRFGAAANAHAMGHEALRTALQAIESREGIIAAKTLNDKGARIFQTILAAPLLHGDEVLGCLTMIGRSPQRVYAEDDLNIAMAFAGLIAPHLRAIWHMEELEREVAIAKRVQEQIQTQLLGQSPVMTELRALLSRAAKATNLNVLIVGETGTGKELAATAIHAQSPRAQGPFVIVNCAAIPPDLAQSELFGHETGSFTGATRRRRGRFEEAHGGTLFLDEVADLSLEMQAAILRVIETGEFYPLGSDKPLHADFRIVAATNKTLAEPEFRQDLYYRLNGLTIAMPPLREHIEDLPELARHFLEEINSHDVASARRSFSTHTLDHLSRYDWPGNVRQMRAAIHRAIATSANTTLSVENFEFLSPNVQYLDSNAVEKRSTTSNMPRLPLKEMERRYILEVLLECDGNIAAAAKILGVARGTLYKKVHEARLI